MPKLALFSTSPFTSALVAEGMAIIIWLIPCSLTNLSIILSGPSTGTLPSISPTLWGSSSRKPTNVPSSGCLRVSSMRILAASPAPSTKVGGPWCPFAPLCRPATRRRAKRQPPTKATLKSQAITSTLRGKPRAGSRCKTARRVPMARVTAPAIVTSSDAEA